MIVSLIYIIYIMLFWGHLNEIILLIGSICILFHFGSIFMYIKKGYKIFNIPLKIQSFEIQNTLLAAMIYSMMIVIIFLAYKYSYINFDFTVSWWLIPYLGILMVYHDSYYYFLHRCMHISNIYPYIHKEHHRSIHTNIFSAYNFDYKETILEAFFILPIFFFDINIYAGLLLIFLNGIGNTIGHSGFEHFTKTKNKKYCRLMISSSYHHAHHTKPNCNFGLYFSFWDKLLGTYSDEYEQRMKK